ncbi:MAG: ferric reductase-like transmembrane domain-containing protein [Bacteroidales bacterium]
MKYSYHKGILWLFIYTILALLPLFLALWGDLPEYRNFWMELGVALGFIGLGMLALQCVFTGRFIQIAPDYGMDNVLQYHREAGIIAFIFVLAHPLIILITNPEFLYYFDPGINAPRAIGLSIATFALILVFTSSMWRNAFGLSYEKWRLLHGFLSFTIVVIGAGHAIQVAHYLSPLWKQASILALSGASAYLIIHTRIVRPWLNKKKPYKVIEVNTERCQCHTLVLEPAGNRSRLNFIPGQFVWITIGSTPFSMQQNPYSITSSSREKYISLTAKDLGDFSGSWKDIKPGTKAFLEGPYGSFTPKPDKNVFMVMGGIGFTPGMSMLRTFKDDNDKRKIILIYGNENWDEVLYREELEDLSQDIDLTTIHLLEKPPDKWDGETGFVTEELLSKYLPENPSDFAYYICGPKPIMDITEFSLRNLGVDWRLIYSERFEII